MAKVLIADDSPTIHKVVQLTLANSGFDLDIASNSDELIKKLKDEDFDLVLLDFTLSDKLDGYELSKQINDIKKSKILAMLGTFDSIDDNKMVEVGILDKIQKPFESQKFINLCKHLVETDINSFSPNSIDDKATEEQFLEDDWVVNTQTSDAPSEESVQLTSNEEEVSLESELDSWGVQIPNVIGKNKSHPLFPPVIEAKSPTQDLASLVDDEISEEGNTFDFKIDESPKNLSFSSTDDLAPEEDDSWSSETLRTNSSPESEQMIMELSQVDSEEFWATDLESEGSQEVEVRNDLSPQKSLDEFEDHEEEEAFHFQIDSAPMKDEDLELPSPKSTLSLNEAPASLNYDEIADRVIEKLAPRLEEIVKKLFASKIEEVSWEVIPDLAENLIKSEIRKISDSVTDSSH
ncbi:MAG: response regulator [Bacteriovoracaceae bacterium]